MVNDFYYDNLEQILAFTGGRQLLNWLTFGNSPA